jgi:hypothetical protein
MSLRRLLLPDRDAFLQLPVRHSDMKLRVKKWKLSAVKSLA